VAGVAPRVETREKRRRTMLLTTKLRKTERGGVSVTMPTAESAARKVAMVRPKYAAVNGVEIDTDSGFEYGQCVSAVSAAMAAGDWYWLDGSAYCPACVECESPAIDAADPNVHRGGAVSVCSCCKTDYNS
jgi:hypothetical protein